MIREGELYIHFIYILEDDTRFYEIKHFNESVITLHFIHTILTKHGALPLLF